MCLELNFEKLLQAFIQYQDHQLKVDEISKNENGNRVIEIVDYDGSDYCYEFEHWVQRLVSEELRDDIVSTDWHAIAKQIMEKREKECT